MDNILLRNAAPDDASALLAVHQASIRTLGREAYTDIECESWAYGLTPRGYVKAMDLGETFIAAICADAVVAFCSYIDGEIVGLFVHPDWSRQHIASDLLLEVEERIRRSGIRRTVLDAAASAVRFYQAVGYVIEGRTHWTTRGGIDLSSYRMTKDL